MKVNKDNTGLIVVVIVLGVLLIGCICYICYDEFVKKDLENKEQVIEEEKEDLIKGNTFSLGDVKCEGELDCAKAVKLALNDANHEIRLIKRLTDDKKKYTIDVYVDNILVDTLDGGDYSDFWQQGVKPEDNIKNLDGYLYVIDSKYLGIVYRYESSTPYWYIKFYNENKPAEQKPIMLISKATGLSSKSVNGGKELSSLDALEFDGHSVKYWNTYCSKKQIKNESSPSIAQYSLTFDGSEVTKTVGTVLNDATIGGQGGPCTE